jgi:hypothetical protein
VNASDRKVQDENEPLSELVKNGTDLQKSFFFYRKIVVLEGKTRKNFCSINFFLFLLVFLHDWARGSFLSCTFPSLFDHSSTRIFYKRYLLPTFVLHSSFTSPTDSIFYTILFLPLSKKKYKKKACKTMNVNIY